MRTLILLESREQVRIVASRADLLAGATLLCVSPAAANALETHGLEFRYPDFYVDSDELQRRASGHFDVLEEICAALDGVIARIVPAEFCVPPRMFLKNLKVAYDALALRVLQLRKVLEAEAPARIILFEPFDLGFDDRLQFMEGESIYSHVLPFCAARSLPDAEVVVLDGDVLPVPPIRVRLARAARRAGGSWRSLVRRFTTSEPRGADPVLCIGDAGYGVESVLPLLERQVRLYRWLLPPFVQASLRSRLRWIMAARTAGIGLPALREAYAEAWRTVRASSEIHRRLLFEGVDLFAMLQSRLSFLVEDMLPRAALLRAATEAALGRHRGLRAVFSVNFSLESPWTYVLALAARARGVPIVTYQHSAFGYFHWPYSKYVDEVMSDYRLVWGQGAVNFMREADVTGCTPIITGSLEMQALRRRIAGAERRQRSRPLIVYPLAGYTGNRFYFAHHRLTDTATFELTKRVLRLLGDATYADVIVKLYPGQSGSLQEPITSWLAQKQWPHIHAIHGGRFGELLADAALVVVDSPSTVLVQAVLSNARLIVHTGVYRMVDEALALLQRRASVFSGAEPFLKCLEATLGSRAFDNDSFQNEEFARLYCGEPHGDVRGNIAEALLCICHAHVSLERPSAPDQ